MNFPIYLGCWVKHALYFIHPPEGCVFEHLVALVWKDKINHCCNHRVGVLVLMTLRIGQLQNKPCNNLKFQCQLWLTIIIKGNKVGKTWFKFYDFFLCKEIFGKHIIKLLPWNQFHFYLPLMIWVDWLQPQQRQPHEHHDDALCTWNIPPSSPKSLQF